MKLVERDKNINDMEEKLKEHKIKLLKKYKLLNKESNEDEFYLEDYKDHFKREKENMKSQIIAFEGISKHLDKLAIKEKSNKDIFQEIKRDQTKVLKEIKKIRKELENIKDAES